MDQLEVSRADVRTRIAALRAVLRKHHIDAWVVPSSDPHLSEYLPGRWQGREWLSGFTGSVGTLVVAEEFVGLWVDSRYWVQAESQLAGTGIAMMKMTSAAGTGYVDWLASNLAAKQVVGVDGAVLGLHAARTLEGSLAARGIELLTDRDVLNEIWPDRPTLPLAPIYEHAAQYAPLTRAEKLLIVREAMRAAGADWHFISTLDDIAWLFNLRGADVPYNPVFLAHALIGLGHATLFVAEGKVSAELRAQLAQDDLTVAPYTHAPHSLAQLPPHTTLLIDPRRITFGLRQAVPQSVTIVEQLNPSTLAKSRKTPEEIAHVRRAMEQDAAALAEFFAWFESTFGKQRITELDIDEHIVAARARRPGFVCPSFPTIAGFNANGAMPHYRATPEAHAAIEGDGLLLIDSGGQYEYGTTDITRVIPIGIVSAAQKQDFTLVLKGMIALSMAMFPRGTKSPLLDTLARAPIWAGGVDYGHGTGHGVGYFLNVHEGPHGISPSLPAEPHTAMEPGMITSNEPGIYRPGRWGVRIENLVLTVPAPLQNTEFGEFLQFESLTLCPIDTRCIDWSLITQAEIDWLNNYHADVARRVLPLVEGDARAWLQKRTQSIPLLTQR